MAAQHLSCDQALSLPLFYLPLSSFPIPPNKETPYRRLPSFQTVIWSFFWVCCERFPTVKSRDLLLVRIGRYPFSNSIEYQVRCMYFLYYDALDALFLHCLCAFLHAVSLILRYSMKYFYKVIIRQKTLSYN